MAKNDRSGINPFTNKKHLDFINDDKFLKDSYNEYYKIVNRSQLLDSTDQGKVIKKISINLINAVEDFLAKIGRLDYVEDYYDWEFHLVADSTVNAFCMPGGKIIMFSGMLNLAESEDDIALVLGHEMAHALLDHSRTQNSAIQAKNTITTAARIGSIGLNLLGMGELGDLTRTVTTVADIGSDFFLTAPFGREQEFEADKLGMMIMHWAGYDISKAPSFWSRVSANDENKFDFFSTHPADYKRINNMKQLIQEINAGKDFYTTPVLGNSTYSISNQNTIHCNHCKKLIVKDSKFCTFCGNRVDNELDSKINCPNCNALISKDFVFCTNCGFEIKNSNS